MVVFENTLLGEPESPQARPSRYFGLSVNASGMWAFGTGLCSLRRPFGRVPSYEDFAMNNERPPDGNAIDKGSIGREGP